MLRNNANGSLNGLGIDKRKPFSAPYFLLTIEYPMQSLFNYVALCCYYQPEARFKVPGKIGPCHRRTFELFHAEMHAIETQ